MSGYLNEGGKLNLHRFEVFMETMSEIDRELFRDKYQDLQYMESKYVRRNVENRESDWIKINTWFSFFTLKFIRTIPKHLATMQHK